MLKKSFFIILCVGFIVSLSSCDTIKTYTDKVLNLTGFESATKPDQQKSSEKKPSKTTQKDKTKKTKEKTKTPSVKKDNTALPKEKSILPEKLKTTDSNIKTPPKFKANAPINVKKRVGGVATGIFADEHYIYMDFPQNYAVYDPNFNLLTRGQTSFPIKSIKRVTKNKKTLLYLKQQGNVLEVFELAKSQTEEKTVHSLIELKSFEVEGDFTWLDDNTLIVFLESKLQFLNLKDLNNIKIITEVPVGGVTAAFKIGKYLYLSRQGFLDVLSLKNYDLLSSLRIGNDFGFFGTLKQAKNTELILSIKSQNGNLQGIQYLLLNDDLSGVADFGSKLTFEVELANTSFDLSSQMLIGREFTDNTIGPVQLYNLNYNRFLRGPLTINTKLIAWSFHNSQLYLVSDTGVTINKLDLNKKVISQSESVKKILNKTLTNVPLAQIGATKLVKDEYQLKTIDKLDLMSDSRKVVLLNKDLFGVIENTANPNIQSLYTTATFSKDNYTLKEPSLTRKTTYDKVLTTDFGVFIYSAKTQKISLLDSGFNNIQSLSIGAKNLISWIQFSANKKDYLAISSMSPTPQGSNKQYQVRFYQLDSPNNMPIIETLFYKERPFVFYVPKNQIVVLTKKQMDLYDWDQMSPEEQDDNTVKKENTPIEPLETVSLGTLKHDFLAAKISPDFKRIYATFKSDNILNVLTFNIFNIKDYALLKDFDIEPHQFDGSSFSKKGRLFILPSSEGTLFYDMSLLSNVRKIANWPLPSHHVDVAMQGQFICVALGHKGVYCGDLLF